MSDSLDKKRRLLELLKQKAAQKRGGQFSADSVLPSGPGNQFIGALGAPPNIASSTGAVPPPQPQMDYPQMRERSGVPWYEKPVAFGAGMAANLVGMEQGEPTASVLGQYVQDKWNDPARQVGAVAGELAKFIPAERGLSMAGRVGERALPYLAQAYKTLPRMSQRGIRGIGIAAAYKGVESSIKGEMPGLDETVNTMGTFAVIDMGLHMLGPVGRGIAKLYRQKKYAKAAQMYADVVKGNPAIKPEVAEQMTALLREPLALPAPGGTTVPRKTPLATLSKLQDPKQAAKYGKAFERRLKQVDKFQKGETTVDKLPPREFLPQYLRTLAWRAGHKPVMTGSRDAAIKAGEKARVRQAAGPRRGTKSPELDPKTKREAARREYEEKYPVESEPAIAPEGKAFEREADRLGATYQGEIKGKGGKPVGFEVRIETGPAKGANINIKSASEMEAKIAAKQKQFADAKAPTETLGFMGANPEAAAQLMKNIKDVGMGTYKVGSYSWGKLRELSDAVGATDKNLTGLGKQAHEAVTKRYANMQIASEDLRVFVAESQKRLSGRTGVKGKVADFVVGQTGRAAKVANEMKFYVQKTGNPYYKDRSFADIAKDMTTVEKAEATKVSDQFARIRREFNEAGLLDDVGFIDNYVTQMWTGSKEAINNYKKYLRTRNPFAKQREIFSYEAGINKFGLKPKHENIYDILSEYGRINEQVKQNNILVESLRKMKAEGNKPMITLKGDNLPILANGESWVEVKSPALFRAAGGKGGGGSVWVHPQIKEPIKTVFEDYNASTFGRVVDLINATSKSIKLASSLFHHVALTESALYSGIAPWNAKKGLSLLSEKATRDDMIKSGLEITVPSDAQKMVVDKFLLSAEKKLGKVAGKVPWILHKGKQLNDKILWDSYHRPLKAYAYQTKVANELKRLGKNKALTEAEVTEVKQAVARHVNNAFGGQNWNAIMKSPKWQKMAHRMLLAPDWTLSNIRIASSAGKGLTKGASLGSKVEGRQARRYWGRAAVYFLTITDAANLALSGHHMWDNESGHKLDIDIGKTDDTGRNKYIKLSKQVREPIRWGTMPFGELGAKAAPTIHMASEQLTGYSASGWRTDIDRKEWDLADRFLTLAKHYVPFSMSGNNYLFSFPMSSGEKPKTFKASKSRGVPKRKKR